MENGKKRIGSEKEFIELYLCKIGDLIELVKLNFGNKKPKRYKIIDQTELQLFLEDVITLDKRQIFKKDYYKVYKIK